MEDKFIGNDNYKSYYSHMDDFSQRDILEGLLKEGFFSEKLPQVFTMHHFYNYAEKNYQLNSRKSVTNLKALKCQRSSWIVFRYRRNIGIYREFGIPNPFCYLIQSYTISKNWKNILKHFKKYTKNQRYKVSRIHIKKQQNSKQIFKMNYKVSHDNPIPSVLIGKRFSVKCDISRCFPSIYTHAIDWAIQGKRKAKNNKSKNISQKMFFRAANNLNELGVRLDQSTRNTTNGETHGLLIGPHASNILSEIILVKIDQQLIAKGFTFIRHIDDYECFTNTYDEAENFTLMLDRLLSEYKLSLNVRKTIIQKLPYAEDLWVYQLQNQKMILSPYHQQKYKMSKMGLKQLFDYAIDLTKRNDDNSAILNYTFRMIKGIAPSAEQYFREISFHLLYLYPYLLPIAEEEIFSKVEIPRHQIACFSQLLFNQAFKQQDYLSCCYALHFAVKFEFELDLRVLRQIKKTDDCLLLLFGWRYVKYWNILDQEGDFKALAKKFAEYDFESHWLFVYEVLESKEFEFVCKNCKIRNNQEWQKLKDNNVSFLK